MATPEGGATQSRRDELLTIAGRVFAEKGIAHTTVRDIAERAGILSGSLYHHFESKHQMVTEIVAAGLAEAGDRDRRIAAAAPDPATAMTDLVTNLVVWVGSEPEVARILVNDQRYLRQAADLAEVQRQRDRNRDCWIAVIRAGVDAGTFRADLDPEIVVRAIFDGALAASRWLPPAGSSDPAQVGAELARFYVAGLRAGFRAGDGP